MKFYNREKELQKLAEMRKLSFEIHSQMTVVTGRRRIGKTKLIIRSCEDTPTIYWFVGRNNEVALCSEFSDNVRRSLDVFVPDGIQSIPVLFEYVMNLGKTKKFNLIIDEFQEFYNINPSILSSFQDIWDRNRDISHINFIASGSVYTLMHKIFMDYGEPLYGRCDAILRIKPFSTSVIKEILTDYNKEYTNDDLLALYTITGGVPKYIEYLMDRNATTVDEIYRCVFEQNSIFIEEGSILLIQEFGKKYGNYFAILAAISAGGHTLAEIGNHLGDANLGGMLTRLENDYNLISKVRPILSKERSQNVRYEITDNFLRFWFRYIYRNQDLVQLDRTDKLYNIAIADYPTYSGKTLEGYFKSKLAEEGEFRQIGSWWLPKLGLEASEIDIVAIGDERNTAFVAEVKRQRRNYDHRLFMTKVERLSTTVLHGYELTTRLLTMEDM